MKCLYCLIIFLIAKFVSCDIYERYGDDTSNDDLDCPYDRICVNVDYCPGVEAMMNRKTIPVHRFRSAVCGYEGTSVKICCNPTPDVYSLQNGFRETRGRAGLKSECGISFVPLNVTPVSVGSFPFLARIGFINLNDGQTRYPCTGTIVGAITVLTTATCALAQSDDYKLQSVLVGEYDTSTDPDCNCMFCGHRPNRYKIAYVLKHPNFNAETFANNVALIRLQDPINFTVTVQPACVYNGRDFNLPAMDEARLFGWGKLASETIAATELRSLYMRLLSRQQCVDFANRGLCVELCAIGEQEPCSGFSGSPLIRMYRNKYVVIGILSYGSTCENGRNNPVALVDVQQYADWIAQN